MKRPSLKLRITAWFALMMFVIEALVLAFLLAVNGTVATNDPEARLVRMVEHNADRVKYNHRQFRFSRIHYNRSGVYTVLYDADGNVLQGTFPAEFTPSEPLPLGGETVRLGACHVDAVDTTAAGDTFIGYFVRGIVQNLSMRDTLRQATVASAIAVTRPGAADAVPALSEVLASPLLETI